MGLQRALSEGREDQLGSCRISQRRAGFGLVMSPPKKTWRRKNIASTLLDLFSLSHLDILCCISGSLYVRSRKPKLFVSIAGYLG